MSEGVAAAKRAAAESLPFLPHSYELTPHERRMRGTCMLAMAGGVGAIEGEREGESIWLTMGSTRGLSRIGLQCSAVQRSDGVQV